MILDTLDNWQRYSWGRDRLVKAFQFLESFDASQADGRYDIDGEDVFCSVATYETNPRAGREFEAHRVYADIQYMLDGAESILWAPLPELSVTKPYVPDIEFYGLTPGATEVILSKGRFCVLFPQDAHAPSLACDAPSTVRKAVVKVRVA